MTSDSSTVVFDELTIGDRFRVFWGFIWRGFLTTTASVLVAFVVGALLGFVFGLVAHLLGWPMDSIKRGGGILGGIAGVVVGFCAMWQYIRWLFRAKWLGYQLRFVRQGDKPFYAD